MPIISMTTIAMLVTIRCWNDSADNYGSDGISDMIDSNGNDGNIDGNDSNASNDTLWK